MWTRKDVVNFKDAMRSDKDTMIRVGSGETVTVGDFLFLLTCNLQPRSILLPSALTHLSTYASTSNFLTNMLSPFPLPTSLSALRTLHVHLSNLPLLSPHLLHHTTPTPLHLQLSHDNFIIPYLHTHGFLHYIHTHTTSDQTFG